MLDGTEVFHEQCVGQAYRSKLRLAEQRSLDLERQLNETRRAAARAENEANVQRNLASTRHAALIQMTAITQEAQRQLTWEEQVRTETQNALRVAQAELAALRVELAAHHQETGEEEVADATAMRFKLLELD